MWCNPFKDGADVGLRTRRGGELPFLPAILMNAMQQGASVGDFADPPTLSLSTFLVR